MKRKIFKVSFIGLLFGLSSNVKSQWNTVPTPNNEVIGSGVVNSIQRSPDVCALNTAAYTYAVTWHDQRNASTNYDIYAQIYSSNGFTGWVANGVLICNASNQQFKPRIVTSKTKNEFFIAWEDRRNGNYDIYCQKINQLGVVQWTTNGVPVSLACGDQTNIEMIADEDGGVIISWVDQRNGDHDIFIQKVNSSGVVQWKQNGVSISSAIGRQDNQKIVSDGSNGATLVWEDRRIGWQPEVYIQTINSTGVVSYTQDGKIVCTNVVSKINPQIVSSSSALGLRYFVSWIDSRTSQDPYYILLNSNCNPITPSSGTAVSSNIGANARNLNMISDRNNGVFISWDDLTPGNYDVFVQNIDMNGVVNASWLASGTRVCNQTDEQHNPKMASCDNELVIVFHDWRNVGAGGPELDLYYQKVNTSNGSILLGATGNPLATNAYNQRNHRVTVMHGNVVAVWEDERRRPADGGDIFISPIGISCTNFPTTSNAIVVNSNTLNTNDNKIAHKAKIFYPNPASNYFKIQFESKLTDIDIFIYDAKGALVKKVDKYKSNSEIDISQFSTGKYHIVTSDEESFDIIKE